MEKKLDLSEIKRIFPGKSAAMHFLESLRWGTSPVCPHCGSHRVTRFKQEQRNHCNACNVSFSATVNTPFHNTRIPLQKWFRALIVLFENNYRISVRKLASDINVNKNTAWQMISRLKIITERSGTSFHKIRDLEQLFRSVKKEVNRTDIEVLQYILCHILETCTPQKGTG